MKFFVVYYSRGGKTRKVAEVISQQLECEAVDICDDPDVAGADMLIVGTGVYPNFFWKKLQRFLDQLQPVSKTKAAVFVTSGGPNPNTADFIGALEAKGYIVVSNFKCRGRFLFFNWSRPNKEDLENAKTFANDLKKIIGA